MGESSSRDATERVWAVAGEGAREALERRLSPTDLQTLLLAVARARAASVAPARLLHRWSEDRFVRPAPCDPRTLAQVEARLWGALPPAFAGVELSPVAPLGTSAALGAVDQNRVVSTIRGSEVVSDPTNVLALEAAVRRRTTGADVHLAACHRVLRAQDFGGGASQHFKLFVLVSSGRDQGSAATESSFLVAHLAYWRRALAVLGIRESRVLLSPFDSPVVEERLHDVVLPSLGGGADGLHALLDPARTHGRGYYERAALKLEVLGDEQPLEVGDGGFTDWTAQLLSDAKERCLVSCISTERLATVASLGG